MHAISEKQASFAFSPMLYRVCRATGLYPFPGSGLRKRVLELARGLANHKRDVVRFD